MTSGLLASAAAPAFASNDLVNLLKGGLSAIQKAQAQSGQQGEQSRIPGGPAPRFEDGISVNTYLRSFVSTFRARNPKVVDSPFRGLGLVISDNLGPTYINSDASFFGLDTWHALNPLSGSHQQLPDVEAKAIRAELLSRLRWETLVGPVWGQGAARKALVFSAPDCPACLQMEFDLAKAGRSPAYELYYLPIMLNKSSKVAAQIWCANDRVEGWRQAMLKRNVGNSGNCGSDVLSDAVSLALGISKIRPDRKIVLSTPTLLLDTGEMGNWAGLKSKVLA